MWQICKPLEARKRKFSSVNPRPLEALYFILRVLATWHHGTLSGTKNGWRPHSAKALSQRIVAQACGSWFPWTITTTGSEGAQTYFLIKTRIEYLNFEHFLIYTASNCIKAHCAISYLIAKLAIANGEFRPEKKSKLFIHYRFRTFLLCPFDLFETHVSKADWELSSGLMVFHCLPIMIMGNNMIQHLWN